MKKEFIEKAMEEVITTSEQMRSDLLNKEEWEMNKQYLPAYKQAIFANKNIVSASVVLINVEKLTKNEK